MFFKKRKQKNIQKREFSSTQSDFFFIYISPLAFMFQLFLRFSFEFLFVDVDATSEDWLGEF